MFFELVFFYSFFFFLVGCVGGCRLQVAGCKLQVAAGGEGDGDGDGVVGWSGMYPE
jgi:hypothetical protein